MALQLGPGLLIKSVKYTKSLKSIKCLAYLGPSLDFFI